MALTDKSLFLYGFQVTTSNQYIPFRNVNLGAEIDAVIPVGFYTLSTLATAIVLAMNTADPSNSYTCTVDRTFSSNLQNRVTIATSGAFLSLLFNSGTTSASCIAPLIGFTTASDQTGSTSYQSSSTSGTALETSWYGFNYQRPEANLQTIGAVSLSASGVKETVYWSVQQFISVEFRYEGQAFVISSWLNLMEWMIKGQPFEFTPEVKTPSTFYSVTLEKSSKDGKGLGFMMKEMIPDFPLLYQTGPIEMRLLAGTY